MKSPKNSHKLRHPVNLPKSVQWKVEGCAEVLASLTSEDDKIFYLAFLEAEYGNNINVLDYNDENAKRVYNATNANDRDVMTHLRPQDRITTEAYELGAEAHDGVSQEHLSKIQKHEKKSGRVNPALIQESGNSVEDRAIEDIDEAVFHPKILAEYKDPRQLELEKKARIKSRKNKS